jgi:hypothetical protein
LKDFLTEYYEALSVFSFDPDKLRRNLTNTFNGRKTSGRLDSLNYRGLHFGRDSTHPDHAVR